MRDNLPKFKYHPNAYKVSIFEQVPKQNCSVCNNETTYIYSGPFYSVDDVNNICPWCIYDGRATTDFKGVLQGAVEYKDKLLSVSFNDETNEYMYFMGYDDVELIHDDNLEELLFRTPSYIAWQEPQWLSHCNEFCSFVRYLDKSELHDMRNDLQEGVSLLKENYGLSVDQLGEDIGLYLFQCKKCGKYRLHSDHT
ncbi:CbrC family protein [Brevibacillus sp. VP]|uniref:CbrC family protein n=1 Tax=unclassified Brevibacillus TaxID=2684853 RepID=UPI000E2E6C0A|nr:CbrC family protein [Brevibacillus sp. VP]RFB38508.1 hypothetical protein DZB91_01570 [Brevibacillus sp. VP]